MNKKYIYKKEKIINEIKEKLKIDYNDYIQRIDNIIQEIPFKNELLKNKNEYYLIITGVFKSGKNTFFNHLRKKLLLNDITISNFNKKKLDKNNKNYKIDKKILNEIDFFKDKKVYIIEILSNLDNLKKKIISYLNVEPNNITLFENYLINNKINYDTNDINNFQINKNINFNYDFLDEIINNILDSYNEINYDEYQDLDKFEIFF